MEKVSWKELIQMNLQELKEAVLVSSFTEEKFRDYGRALISYLEDDLARLESITTSDYQLKALIDLRVDILKRNVSLERTRELEEMNTKLNAEYHGELYFLLGLSLTYSSEWLASKKYYQTASQLLKRQGSFKKSLKSLMNVAVAECRYRSSKRSIADFMHVANEARKLGDSVVEGISLLNVSYEHQKMGALELSLSFVSQAILKLEVDYGVSHYFSALAHRCHVLIELGRLNEALLDYQVLKTSNCTESIEAIKVIETIMGESELDINVDQLEPTWKKRLLKKEEYAEKIKLTDTDNKLIELLSIGPMSKSDIMDRLYGKGTCEISTSNRFAVLLARIRKKNNISIKYINGNYLLEDEVQTLNLPA